MNFTAKQFKAIRRVHGLTMHRMAEILECSTPYVHGMEHGDHPITENIARKLVARFEITSNRMRAITLHYDNHILPYEKVGE